MRQRRIHEKGRLPTILASCLLGGAVSAGPFFPLTPPAAAAAGQSAPQTTSASKPQTLEQAIPELVKEYKSWLAEKGLDNPNGQRPPGSAKHDKPPVRPYHPDTTVYNGPRKYCNYFESVPPGLTPDDVLNALQKPIPGVHDPRVEAYVKWQLTSALPPRLDGPQAGRVTLLYSRLPPYSLRRPGLLPAPAMERAVKGQQGKELIDLYWQLYDAVEDWEMNSGSTLMYRDALYQRLPDNPHTYMLGFKDYINRINQGRDGWDIAGVLIGHISLWAGIEKNPGRMRTMSQFIERIVKRKPILALDGAWNNQGVLTGIKPRQIALSSQWQLELLQRNLEKLAKSGGAANTFRPSNGKAR